ncbi:hypothetical protein [Amycolatopsis sp. cmx-4-83]
MGWIPAGIGGANVGPGTVDAVAGLAAGEPDWRLTSFLPGTACVPPSPG